MPILPSSYSYILPTHVDLAIVDKLAVEGKFPTVGGLWPAFVYCVIFGVARVLLQRILFTPLGAFAMKIKFYPEQKNPDIDDLLKRSKGKGNKAGPVPITLAQVQAISKKYSMTDDAVRELIRHKRHNKTARLKMVKFSEALWRFIFYMTFVVLGYVALFTPTMVPWLLEPELHWENWPYQQASELIQFYYLIELGSYFHQLMWTEVTRSDAAEMIAHHVITILLISLSWLTNYIRVGAAIIFVHDLADVFLECGKLFNYASKVKEFRRVCSVLTDTFFAMFAVTFFVTRLVVYPRYLVYSKAVVTLRLWGWWPGYWVFTSLLCALQCLHVFWFYLISKMIVKLFAGGIQKDERSDDEDELTIEGEDSNRGTSESDREPVRQSKRVAKKTN